MAKKPLLKIQRGLGAAQQGPVTNFEEVLFSLIGETAEVDGHDFGSCEMNIFTSGAYLPSDTDPTLCPVR